MTELKTWRENIVLDDGTQKSVLTKEIVLPFCSCDLNGKMHLSELLALTSDLAVEDFEDQGLSYQFLYSKGFAILLSRISYKIIKMPLEAQKITLKTWEEKAQGLQLVRKFVICDSSTDGNGQELIYGTTMWLLVDPVARRIMPPIKFDLRPVPNSSSELKTLEPGKIKIAENASLVENRKMQFSDCDPNGHVNNSRYGAFAIDALFASGSAIDEIQGKILTDFRLNYAKEAHLGDTLSIYSSVEKTEDGKTKIIIVGKNAAETSFECEMFWT